MSRKYTLIGEYAKWRGTDSEEDSEDNPRGQYIHHYACDEDDKLAPSGSCKIGSCHSKRTSIGRIVSCETDKSSQWDEVE